MYWKLSIIFAGLACTFLFSGCKNNEICGNFVDKPINIDGNRTDWSSIPIAYNEDNRTAYAICHDSSQLYLLFSFNNPIYARLIKQKGLKIWINTEGKQEKENGIRYSGGPSIEDIEKLTGISLPSKFTNQESPPDIASERRKNSTITLMSSNFPPSSFDLSRNTEYKVSYNIINGICAYEFQLPLARFTNNSNNIANSMPEKIKIGLEWGGMDRKNRPERSKDSGGMGRGGGSRGGGGGRGGKGGPSGGRSTEAADNLASMMEEQEVWLTYLTDPSKKQ